MLENLRAWLNGDRNYNIGVALYATLGSDADLLEVLQKGPNPFRIRRLQNEILQLFNQEKEKQPTPIGDAPEPVKKSIPVSSPEKIPNPELYEACKAEADLAYKKVMNDRAVLFSLANVEDFTDPNMPDKVQAREKLAISVVTGFQKVSELYDTARYVKENGRLPNSDTTTETEFDSLPDELVKQQLDNCRKAFNKLKNKEQTPVRIELMQKHQENIKKLEARWHSLKPTK